MEQLLCSEDVAAHLIDVSIEDDSLLPSLEVVQQAHISHEMTKMSATCDTICEGDNSLQSNSKAEAQKENSSCADEKVLLSDTKEKKRVHVNLRKSLTWNTAFFTEEGVLDQEELFLVNKTLKKTSQPASDFPKKIAQENSLGFSQPQSNPSPNAGSHTIMSGTIREHTVPDIIMKSSSKLDEDVYYFKEASLKVEGGSMNHTHLTRLSFSNGAQETTVTLLAGQGNCNQRETTRNERVLTSTCGRISPEYWGGTSNMLSSIPESPRETFSCADLSRRSSLRVETASLPQMMVPHSKVCSDNNEAIDDANVVTEGKFRTQYSANPSRGGGCGELVKPSGLKRPSPKLGFFDLTKTKETEAKLGYKCGVGSTAEEKKNVDLRSRIPLPPHLRDKKKRKSDITTDNGLSKKPAFLSNQSNTGCNEEEGLQNKSDFPAFRLLPVNTNNSFSLPDKACQQRNALDMNLSKENLSSKYTAEQENICFEDLLQVRSQHKLVRCK